MQQALIKSLIFHAVLLLLIVLSSSSIFGRKETEEPIIAITVDLKVAEKTNIPRAPENNFKKVKPAKKPKPKPKKPQTKPKPPPPEPKPAPKIEVSEKPKEKPKKKPEKKPEPLEDEITSLLKTLEDIDEQPQAEITQNQQDFNPKEEITVSEISAIIGKITKQIEVCWNIPAGARNAADLSVQVDVDVARNGVMKFVKFTDESKYFSDPFYTVAADSVRNAILDPKCNPLKQIPPLDKYEIWRELRLTFTPSSQIY